MQTAYSPETFDHDNLLHIPGPLLVEFGTNWCVHCQAARQYLAPVMAEYPQVRHVQVEDGPGRRLGRAFKVKLWPTMVFLRDGQEVARLVRPSHTGLIEEAFEQLTGQG